MKSILRERAEEERSILDKNISIADSKEILRALEGILCAKSY